MVNISIIIVTYNSKNYIINCIDSIIEKTKKVNYEIIICDNNSIDNTINTVETKFLDKQIKIIKNPFNMGFAKAANIASKQATGEYILFLNPDTVLKNSAIDALYYRAIKNEEIAVLGGKLLNQENKYVFSCGYLPSLDEMLLLLTNNHKKRKLKYININEELYIELISGADFFIKKSVFEELNGFDEDYFMYYEDIDFCYKLKKNGYKLLYYPNAEFIHFCRKSEENMYLTEIYNFKSAFLYCKKNLQAKKILYFWLVFLFVFYFVTKHNLNLNILFKYIKKLFQ